MTDDEIIDGIRQPGRFDALSPSEADAVRLVEAALSCAAEILRAIVGEAYPAPPQGIKTWYQVHPAEPAVGNDLPHVKYADWSRGKKGRGGSWGHVFFPPEMIEEASHVVHD